MPDAKGKLTTDELARTADWIKLHWDKGGLCPVSGHNAWTVGDTMISTTAYTGTGISLGGSVYPMILVICNGCGYTRFLNALVAGIVPRETTTTPPEEAVEPGPA